ARGGVGGGSRAGVGVAVGRLTGDGRLVGVGLGSSRGFRPASVSSGDRGQGAGDVEGHGCERDRRHERRPVPGPQPRVRAAVDEL
ncbi:MAG: hypothetical protein AVDCRST_MAG59-804, partial [uncultured Thermomicrobiales bacterium]